MVEGPEKKHMSSHQEYDVLIERMKIDLWDVDQN